MNRRTGIVGGVGILAVTIVALFVVGMRGISETGSGIVIEETTTPAPTEIAALPPGSTTPPAPTTPAAASAGPSLTPTVTQQVESPPTTPTAGQRLALTPQFYSYRVVNVFPHDPSAWTQGLVFADGILYEGTGLDAASKPIGQSDLRKVDLETGEILQRLPLDEEYFGEGITVWDDRVYQLTWHEQTAFLYDKETFAELGRFSYQIEGWGLTHDGENLIMSDGTPTLYFRNPDTFEETRRVTVTYLGQPVPQLNELEYFDGAIYANVWYTDIIVRIDPATGEITGVIDLQGLLNAAPPFETQASVLNGIAYDQEDDRLFVTGKWWPALFEIELVETDPPQ